MRVILFSIFIALGCATKEDTCSSDTDNKTCESDVNYFPTLPGTGFDNLRNVDMGQVVLNSYKNCRLTDDRKYIVPDDVSVLPIKHSKVEVFSELFEHWHDYTSTSSGSINAQTSLFPLISGRFSDESQSVKKNQVYDQSSTTRVQVRQHLYTVRNDNPVLHPKFKSRVLDIFAEYQNNDTRRARHLTQLLIRDYGTHVVTSVDVGGIYLQLDQIKNTFVRDFYSVKHEVKAAASAWFWKISAGTGFGTSTSETMSEYYRTNRTDSKYQTFGGDPFRVNQTINKWQDGLSNNLVAIDRQGDPLHFMVTPSTFPDVPEPTVTEVSMLLFKEIKRYYDVNTHAGCIKMDSANFNFRANLDDGSCISPYNNYTFGGVYQICRMQKGSNAGDLCQNLIQKNPITGGFTCRDGYEAILLNTGEDHYSTTRRECHKSCSSWLGFACHESCGNIYLSSKARYQTFWCAATRTLPADTGYLFGGMYSSTILNPLTKTQGCPITFLPLRMGADLFVCVSDDYELGYRYSVPFAGFFSCSAGNPLTLPGRNTFVSDSISKEQVSMLSTFFKAAGPGGWPQRCPTGYSQHLAAIDNDCRIDFCIKANALSHMGLPPIHRPPYTKKPLRNINTTETWYIVGPASKIWIKNTSTSTWHLIVDKNTEDIQILDSEGPTGKVANKSNSSTLIGFIIGVSAFGIIGVIAIVIVKNKRCNRPPYGNVPEDYRSIETNRNEKIEPEPIIRVGPNA